MTLKEILNSQDIRLTILVGNGINRYGKAGETNSWRDLLKSLAQIYLPEHAHDLPSGISTTEFFDVLSLQAMRSTSEESSLQKEFCKPLAEWRSFEHHGRLASWARRNNRPILTTNFDTTLSDACDATLQHVSTRGFTDFYPWETYYGSAPITRPSQSFGIWHINGMAHYHRSVRLGLSHYMGSVQRARGWMHRGGDSRLFSSTDAIDTWRGSTTWLDAIFRNDLLIIGLALDEVEVFIRWLLIERARLFQKFHHLRRQAWYVETKDISATGKGIFLTGVGVELLRELDYTSIYESAAWDVA
ncbi:hypothetical protein GFL49_27400 [Rhizobium leguminosarum bv. viciae]|nr:hypothetical protein [Rhizobium leguminosarum bv. viciae]